MTAMGTDIQYRRLRVPRGHGGTLFDPPLASALPLLGENVTLRAQQDRCDVFGQSLLALSDQARRLLLADAQRYTGNYRDVSVVSSDSGGPPILLAGHQPHLSHPGVWLKNFVIDLLARRSGSTAIHLLIDNDVMRHVSVRVPSGSIGQPHLENVLLDRPTRELPYEERDVEDFELFSTFARRVQQTIRPLVPDPMVGSLWPWAKEAAQAGRPLGQCLAQARHRLEETWGLRTLELPLSSICDTPPFRRFMLHLLDRMPTLHRRHNDALAEYRIAHRIRSRSHPVADLTTEDDWQEAPFWIWTSRDPRRRPVFVRFSGKQLQLRAGRVLDGRKRMAVPAETNQPIVLDREPQKALGQLDQLRGKGIKLRPRALVTTMYARLVLGDLFVHGIGGSKYDQLTDLLILRFFGLVPPGFLTVSATLRLPIDRPNVSAQDVHHVDWLLRDLWYHPERFLNDDHRQPPSRHDGKQLALEKKKWIDLPVPPGGGRIRHREIEQINEQLRKLVQDQQQQLSQERERLRRLLRNESIMSSREYAFCLFPETELRDLLPRLAGQG